MDAHEHLQLLKRQERLLALRACILDAVTPGSRVLDAGCGSGVLSVWAAQAGASEVVAVDTEAIPIAEALARENGVDGQVRFLERDLLALEPEEVGSFDVILGLLYLNDPRRDREQAKLVELIRKRFLAPGGRLLPDSVRHTGRLVDWPTQDHLARRAAISIEAADIERGIGLSLRELAEAASSGVSLAWFPPKNAGRYATDGYREVSQVFLLEEIDYSHALPDRPESLELVASAPGRATAIIWTQYLCSSGRELFVNESLSWVENPTAVDHGSLVRLEFGPQWAASNVVRLEPA